MSAAAGLLLAYLKVAVLAAAVIAVLWVIGKGAQALYAWEKKASGDGAADSGAGTGEDPRQ